MRYKGEVLSRDEEKFWTKLDLLAAEKINDHEDPKSLQNQI